MVHEGQVEVHLSLERHVAADALHDGLESYGERLVGRSVGLRATAVNVTRQLVEQKKEGERAISSAVQLASAPECVASTSGEKRLHSVSMLGDSLNHFTMPSSCSNQNDSTPATCEAWLTDGCCTIPSGVDCMDVIKDDMGPDATVEELEENVVADTGDSDSNSDLQCNVM